MQIAITTRKGKSVAFHKCVLVRYYRLLCPRERVESETRANLNGSEQMNLEKDAAPGDLASGAASVSQSSHNIGNVSSSGKG